MNHILRSMGLALATVSLAACGGGTQAFTPNAAKADHSATSTLRVTQARHVTAFASRATYARSSDGVRISVDGRSVFFPGTPDVALRSVPTDNGGRQSQALPVTCADCGDPNGGGGWTGQHNNSVQSVDASASGVDVVYTSAGSDSVTIVGQNANGTNAGTWTVDTNYPANMLIQITFDVSVFGGTVPTHGQVTVTTGGVKTGGGSW